MIRCGSKNGHCKGMCSRDIRLGAQIVLAILDSMVKIGGVLYDHLMTMENFTLIMNKVFI